jgi:hypothetical protein
MIVSELPRTSTPIQGYFLVAGLPRWRFLQGSMKKLVSMKELNNCHSELVNAIYNIVGYAIEVIPKTLATNCGMDVVRIIT